MELSRILEKNRELKGLHAGRRCFIIGNGPSIASQDLLLLKDDIKIVANHFYRHKDCRDINPDYWLCADPDVWKKQDLFLVPLLKAIEKQEINTRMFFPREGMIQMKRGLFLNIHYFFYDVSKGIDEDIDFTEGIPLYGQNVLLVGLMLAFYLGCNPIYLLGADHTWWSWKRDEYRTAETPHFFKNNYSPISQRYSYDLLQSTIWVQKYQYLQLIKYAAKRGFRIFNGTEGGYLDLFPRVSFRDLFPTGTRSMDKKSIISAIPDVSFQLGMTAVKLINQGEYISSLVLIDEAISRNAGKDSRVEGLDYLRSICLMGLGEYREAIKGARQDYSCNPSNRSNALSLLKALGDDRIPEPKDIGIGSQFTARS